MNRLVSTTTLLSAATALLLLQTAPAVAERVMRVGVQENSTPKFIVGTQFQRSAQGVCPDVMRAIEKYDPKLRFVFETQAQPLRRIELRMERSETDANCLVNNDERRARFQVVAVPLFSLNYHLIARAADAVDVSSWDDVRRLGAQGRILVVSGTGVTERLQKVGGLMVEDSGKSASVNLRKLVSGRGRFFYYRTHDWEVQVRAALVGGQVRILPIPMESVPFHLMLGRHIEPDAALRVERALRHLDANGTLAQLRAKWELDSQVH